MISDDSVLQQSEAHAPLLVVVGAGPKAAALAVKAKVMRDLGIGEVRIIVIESNEVAANWKGGFGFTDGQNELCTPPEKDVGFPYNSVYGSKVDIEMLRYTWQQYLLEKTSYSDWIDRGRQQPQLKEWARYVEWALEFAEPEEIVRGTTVTSVEPSGDKLIVMAKRKSTTLTYEADGVVLTGPGDPIKIPESPAESKGRIFDGRNYWTNIKKFEEMQRGKVAVIGGGGTAASIVLSLLQKAPVLDIQVINPRGSMFIRGESVREKRLFCNSADWLSLDEFRRLEFIKRTDRGVFSLGAQKQFDQAEKLEIISGEVTALEEAGDKIIVRFKYGDDPPKSMEYEHDRVIVALGFDPFSSLTMITQQFRPKAQTPAERLEIQRKVDEYLRLPFDSVPDIAGAKPNIHVPMLAGLAYGPGFPNLTCLGRLSDRILSLYVASPDPSRRSQTRT